MVATTTAAVSKVNKAVIAAKIGVPVKKNVKTRKKPELRFVSDSGAQIMLLVQHGEELSPMKEYCKKHDINFGGLKRRLLTAGRVDHSKTLLRLESNDPTLVQASMRSSSLRVVAIGLSAQAYYVYSSDIPKLPETISHVIDIRGRRISCDGGSTWADFAAVEGAEPIKRPEVKQRARKSDGPVEALAE